MMMMTEGLEYKFKISPSSPQSQGAQVIHIESKEARAYRGAIEILRLSGSDMTVINELSMNEYLYGVVPKEVGGYAHMEAMKAQAVSARTYTMNAFGKHKDLAFDICDTQYCQVYGGFLSETEKSNRAVDETGSAIVRYLGKPAQVFYFSSSGGQTEDVQYVWGSSFPYLVSVEDQYETGKTSNYQWKLERTPKQVQGYLSQRGVNIGELLDIEIAKRAPSGRVTRI
jgi:stage II sporulation protein D